MEEKNLFECVSCGCFSDDGDLINHICLACIENAYLDLCADCFFDNYNFGWVDDEIE